jgi:hypothetical protein
LTYPPLSLQSDWYILGNPNRIPPHDPPNHTKDTKQQTQERERKRSCKGEHAKINPKEQKSESNTKITRSTRNRNSQKGKRSRSIMAEQRAHPCKTQRMKHECRKDRIRQGVATFLTTIIITMIILNTGTRNMDVHKQGTPTPQWQPGQCTCRQTKDQPEGTYKQFNRDDNNDSRSMDNESNKTAKTKETIIINHDKQLKDKYKLSCIINHYNQLDTHRDSIPEQQKDQP